MCAACHYRGDSQLVLRADRAAAHGDGDWHCVRVWVEECKRTVRCVDCGDLVDDLDHACEFDRMAANQLAFRAA